MNNFFIAQTFGKSSNYTDIPNHLFKEHNVKKGLRNEDGTGVRVGLTRVSDVVGYEIQDGKKVNVPGKLFYRGIEIGDLVKGKGNARYGFSLCLSKSCIRLPEISGDAGRISKNSIYCNTMPSIDLSSNYR